MIAGDEGLHRMQRAFRGVLDAFARPGTVRTVEPAFGNPARPTALDASLEQVVRLFVDQAVTFCIADSETDAAAAYLSSETHARRAPLRDADFVVVPARADAQTAREAVGEACRGTLVAPEKGATVLMGCARLAEVPEGDGVDEAKGGGEAGEVKEAGEADEAKEVGEAEGTGEAKGASEASGCDTSEVKGVGEPAMHVVALRGPGVERENRFAVDRVDWLRARAERGDEFPCGIEIVLVDPEGRVVAIPRSSSATLVGDPSSMFHVKQSPHRSAAEEQMFHVKHSEGQLCEESQYEEPADGTPVDEASMGEVPLREGLAGEVSADRASAGEAPTGEAPTGEAPAGKAPTNKTSANGEVR